MWPIIQLCEKSYGFLKLEYKSFIGRIWNTSGHLTMVCRSTQAEMQEYRAPLLCPMTRLRSHKWAARCEVDVGPLVNQGWIQVRKYHCAKCSLLTSVAIPKAASLHLCFSSPQTKATQGKCLRPEGNFRTCSWFLPFPLQAHFTIFLYRNSPLFLRQSFHHVPRLDLNSLV